MFFCPLRLYTYGNVPGYSEKSMRLSLFLLLLVLNWSCQKATKASELSYFDLAGLMQAQIGHLKKENPAVIKNIILGEQQEEVSLDSLDWEKELALFVQADINKRAYAKSYTVIEKGNETEYKLSSGESLPVRNMRVVFNPDKTVSHIYISTATSNYLMESQRKLDLSFENGRLTTYGIHSEQELFIGDPEKIEISGRIVSK